VSVGIILPDVMTVLGDGLVGRQFLQPVVVVAVKPFFIVIDEN